VSESDEDWKRALELDRLRGVVGSTRMERGPSSAGGGGRRSGWRDGRVRGVSDSESESEAYRLLRRGAVEEDICCRGQLGTPINL
jgi:hypothetical protein